MKGPNEVNAHNLPSKDIAKKNKKTKGINWQNKGTGEGNVKGQPTWA